MAIESLNNVNRVYQGSAQDVEPKHKEAAEVKNQEKVSDSAKTSGTPVIIEKNNNSGVEVTEKTSAQIKKAIEEINKRAHSTSAQFSYNEQSNHISVKIIDVDTEEVIQEFPPEKTLDLISKAYEMVGLFVDEGL